MIYTSDSGKGRPVERLGELTQQIRTAPKAHAFAKLAWATAKSRGDGALFQELIHQFRHIPALARFSKTAVPAGSTAAAAWGSDLSSYDGLASEFVELTNAQSVFGKLNARRIGFNQRTIVAASPTSAAFVKPGGAIAVTAMSLDDVAVLKRYKVATISVFTNESLELFSRAVQANITDRLSVSVVRGLDSALLDPDSAGVSEETPASLLSGISPLALFGSTAATALSSIEDLLRAHVDAGSDLSRVLIVMHPSTALALSMMRDSGGGATFPSLNANGTGNIAGVPVATTASAQRSGSPPEKLVIALDGQKIVYADDGGIDIQASRFAALQMDSAPTNDASNGTGSSQVSMFQVESSALKVVRVLNFQRAHSSAVAWMSCNF